ncbi:hypothetical protein HNP55_003898 [Paucibacter oligotrophus]|uniref:DUF3138 family protein n=1 Tax=Roseateles oligotrophus TaxID=1769250 RepID=A0A840LC95_9BURK|nr:hypothetical protein [Roseateles oligotrophus]
MKTHALNAIAVALGLALPGCAIAQPAELLQELRRMQEGMTQLQARVQELESQLKAATPQAGQWGMTPEQARQLGRITVKTEALEEWHESLGHKGLKISGMMDPVYLYSSGQDRAGFQFLNAGDGGEYAIDNGAFGMAMLDFQKELDGGSRWRLTLAPNRGGGGIAIDGKSIIHEASVSLPLGDLQTRLIAGQIPDWSGHEPMQATLNKFITHNLLFDFTLPAVYTGAGLELARGKWLLKGLLANVNSSRRKAGEKAPALVYRIDYAKGEFSGFGLAGLHGRLPNYRALDPAGNPVSGLPYDASDSWTHTLEIDGYFIRGDWTLSGQIGGGLQKRAAISADPLTGELRDSRWWGLSALAAYKLSPKLEAMLRADYLSNGQHGGGALGYSFADGRNGLGPAPGGDPERGADRYALALGLRYAWDANTLFKLEYRLDRASLPVFLDLGDDQYRRSNQIFGGALVMSF